MQEHARAQFKGAVFDLDGVMVNTVALHFAAWQRMFAEYGRKFTFDDYKAKVDGISRFEGAQAILTDLSDQEVQQACDKKQAYFFASIKENQIPVFDSTIALIRQLQKEQIRVATISASRNCKFVLEKINMRTCMDAIVDGEDITKSKPDPETFLKAAEKMGVRAVDCIVFEDAVLGVEGAKRANMKCVGIDRYDSPGRLAQADFVVSDLKEVNLQILSAFFANRN